MRTTALPLPHLLPHTTAPHYRATLHTTPYTRTAHTARAWVHYTHTLHCALPHTFYCLYLPRFTRTLHHPAPPHTATLPHSAHAHATTHAHHTATHIHTPHTHTPLVHAGSQLPVLCYSVLQPSTPTTWVHAPCPAPTLPVHPAPQSPYTYTT